jgi:multiple sugar transport system ATP-binding protein
VGTRAEIAQLHRRLKTTMIYVTHDQVEAMTLADKIVVLRSGRVEQVGAPLDLYNDPANQFVAGFIGSPRMNFLSGRAIATGPDGLTVELPGVGTIHTRAVAPGAVGQEVAIGVRPEHIRQGHGARNNVVGTVINVEQLGGLSYVRLNDPDMTVQLGGQTRLRFGDRTEINLPEDDIHVFDAQGLAMTRAEPAHHVAVRA